MEKWWKELDWKAKCFWISLVVVIIGFMVPIESEQSRSGNVTIYKKRTLFQIIIGAKPDISMEVYIKGDDP